MYLPSTTYRFNRRKNLTTHSPYSSKLQENAKKLPGGIPAEALVAFVVFNYSESMAR
jgi:hypothetical protein